jgi:hypothetical protein
MKIIVYTVNIGGYDKLNPAPVHPNPDFEFLYFTDGEAPDGWNKVEIESGDRKASRFWKINSHLLPPHDISIYVDASAYWKKFPAKMINYLDDCDIGLPEHPTTNCVYDHALKCLQLKLGTLMVIFKQVGRYANEGLPQNFGLTENGLIIRKNNAKIKELNELWWKEYQEGSQRDQLSMPYALWKVKPKLKILPFSARENKWFTNNLMHLKSRHIC